MEIFSFNEDGDRLLVVEKSEGEMTVVIKLKNADKESEQKMNFTPNRLVYLYKLHTHDFLVHNFCVSHACILSGSRLSLFSRKE